MKTNLYKSLWVAFGLPLLASANPQGLTVQSGTASAVVNGQQLTITASHNAFLNWQSFNIAAGQTTTFNQPSASSIVWNQINDANPSQIYGNLTANGIVVLMNQSGFYFGPNSFVSAAGLIVSTAPVGPIDSSAGLFWQFTGPAPSASIINYGQINVGKGGAAFLIAERIENHGRITALEGSIGLIAGQEVLLSERPDGRGLSATVKLPSGSVDNSGQLIADAGTIALQALVVNQGGLVQANSIRERNGIIELIASEAVTLGDNSVISANGDSASASAGGQIEIISSGNFADSAASQINVTGGGLGGDGGFVEVSAPLMSEIRSRVDGSSFGGIGGRLLIDPLNIVIGSSGSGSIGTGAVGSGDAPVAGTLTLNVNSAFLGFSRITLQALNNITLNSSTVWDLESSTGLNTPGSLLKLEAGNNITISTGASILGGENWSVTLQAGRNFSLADTVTSGVGTISFAGTSSLQTQNGNINLLAGNNITVGSGHVRTIDGGSITAHAVAGNINTGTKANGFTFTAAGYDASTDLGGISTAKGGDVSLTAGLDVISYLPLPGGVQTDAGSGAFGAAPGNVTINAGRDVIGHYVVRNGVGNITAGHNAGTTSKSLALSLVSGGWTVNAAQDIILQEVRNPNGTYNYFGTSSSPNRYRFDYAADAYTILNGGNSVELRGTPLPRHLDAIGQIIPVIYPGTLEITAGAGGVSLSSDLILFPSPLGNLRITTTAGGSLIGKKSLTQLIMSDSSKTQFRTSRDFDISDHAAVPIHLNDPDPIRLDIAGNISGMLIGAAKRAEINVGGNMINSRFAGQNLRAGDVTSINVAGDILNRSIFTSVASPKPNYALFDPLLDLIYPPLTGSAIGIQNQFYYDEATGVLTFRGVMTSAQKTALETLTVRKFDADGQPVFLPNGEPDVVPAEFIPLTFLQKLYELSQDVPQGSPLTGYMLGGGGTFNFNARNLDLGTTLGIVSQGPGANASLADYFTRGADINVNLSGNLDMFSTKIASHNGGQITVLADGNVNVGSRNFSLSGTEARGIFTVSPDDVTVIAGGDININGSRIAAYDGGNVTVISRHGTIDAGVGGSGRVKVEKIYVDPVTREIVISRPGIHGNGIYATTFPKSSNPKFPASQNRVGDIFVAAPEGNITASAGGIVQNPRNRVDPLAARVTLLAGIEAIRDGNGNVTSYEPVFSSGNLVSDQTLAAAGRRLRLVNAAGNPVLDADQNPIYVVTLLDGQAHTVFTDGRSFAALELAKTLAEGKLRLQLIEPQPNDGSDRVILDANKKPLYVVQLAAADEPRFVLGRNIDVSGSGVIGGNVKVDATGDVNGFIFARGDSDINARQEVVGTILTVGNANVSAGGDISGTVIGIGGISASGASVDASLLSQNITTSGDVGSSQQGFAQGTAANSASQSLQNDDQAKTLAASAKDAEEDESKKRGSGPRLAKTTGRVTVILPAKS